MLITATQTTEWDGRSWVTHPSAAAGPVVGGSAVPRRCSGAAVAPIGAGSSAAYTDGTWETISVSEGTLLNPPILSIATVGDRVIVFDAPRSDSETGTLEQVPL